MPRCSARRRRSTSPPARWETRSRSAAQTRPGDEILVHQLAHVVAARVRRLAVLSACRRGWSPASGACRGRIELAQWMRDPADIHQARQSLVCIENTVGEQGGLIYPQERIDALAAFAHERGMRLHMDGARLWNAAVAARQRPGPDRARCRLGLDLLLEGAGRAGRLGRGRQRRTDRRAPVAAASCWAAACARPESSPPARCTRPPPRRAAGRRPRQRPHAGRGSRRLPRLRSTPSGVETNIVFGDVPRRQPPPALVEEMAAAGVLCAGSTPATCVS